MSPPELDLIETITARPGHTADWYAGHCRFTETWTRATCWALWDTGKLVLSMDEQGFVTFKINETSTPTI